MIIGILKLFLYIPQSNSLKDKRMVLNGFKKRLRNNFNISISSIDETDKWQRDILVVVCVGSNGRAVNQLLNEVVNFTKTVSQLELLDYSLELL